MNIQTTTGRGDGLRQSHLFTKTRREAPADEVSRNAELLIRAGFVHKELAGVYTYLPLGLRTLNKIEGVIREEMDAIGGQELQLSALQDKAVWEATERWDSEDVDVWFKTALQNGQELGLGFTHEEPITRAMREHITSYRDLPVLAYQIQTKFRNEVRAKSGIMRTREFPMKDLYSFDKDDAGLERSYDTLALAYERIFARVGIGELTYKTFASGGSFSRFSHEYQTVSAAGEDTIFVHRERKIAVNKEVFTDKVLDELGLLRDELVEERAIEVGNIFKLGTRFTTPLGLTYLDEGGREKPVVMGSYGIGPSRLMGTVAEVLADSRGLVWPREVAPYMIHLVRLGNDPKVAHRADEVFETFLKAGVDVLYDDRDLRAGEKFADCELMGLPVRVVISERTIGQDTLEVQERTSSEAEAVPLGDLIARFA